MEKEHLTKVISSDAAKANKRPFTDRAVEFFTGEDIPTVKARTKQRIRDAADDAKENIKDEFKNFLLDIAESVITGGNPKGTFRRVANNFSNSRGTTNYNSISSSRTSFSRSSMNRPEEKSHPAPKSDYNNIRLRTRGDAEVVIARFNAWIDKYEQGSIADLYELVGWSTEFTDNDYGWKKEDGGFNAAVRRVTDADREHPYLLVVPRPKPL